MLCPIVGSPSFALLRRLLEVQVVAPLEYSQLDPFQEVQRGQRELPIRKIVASFENNCLESRALGLRIGHDVVVYVIDCLYQ